MADEKLLLTPEMSEKLLNRVFDPIKPPPKFVATIKTLIAEVWEEAQYKAKQHYEQKRLDRPELREKALYNTRVILWRYFREQLTPEAADDIAEEIYNQILALIPDIEEAVIQARKEQMVLDWAQAGKDVEEAKKQAELDGYAKGFAEGVNKGTVIGEKQERERIIEIINRPYGDDSHIVTNSLLLFRKHILNRIGKP